MTRRSPASLPSLVLLGLAAGCQDYHWNLSFRQAEDFLRIEESARQQNRHLFIFYKDFLDRDSARMHEMLTDPEVGALFQDTVNVLLDQSGGRLVTNYMGKYGVTSPPAMVIVAPDGRPEVAVGYLPKERLLEFVRKAKSPPSAEQRRPPPKPRAP